MKECERKREYAKTEEKKKITIGICLNIKIIFQTQTLENKRR